MQLFKLLSITFAIITVRAAPIDSQLLEVPSTNTTNLENSTSTSVPDDDFPFTDALINKYVLSDDVIPIVTPDYIYFVNTTLAFGSSINTKRSFIKRSPGSK